MGSLGGGEGRNDLALCLWGSDDDCNRFGGSSGGIAGRVSVASVTFDRLDCQQDWHNLCQDVRVNNPSILTSWHDNAQCIAFEARHCTSSR